ncbi:GNAT family N-acetyltransferase [Clostridia bacterium]|nr:GNAT family N-acetyltransferase [Clostridia bacterium]
MTEKEFNIIWNLFLESFSKDERRTKKKQYALIKNPLYHLDAYQENNETIAFLAYWNFGDFLYVEHLATEPKMRGKGIGRKIIKDLTHKSNKLVVLEAEKPHDEMAKRRIHFYERLGFYVNDYEYYQPSYGEDKDELSLLFLSHPRAISHAEFEKIRQTIYREVYQKDI